MTVAMHIDPDGATPRRSRPASVSPISMSSTRIVILDKALDALALLLNGEAAPTPLFRVGQRSAQRALDQHRSLQLRSDGSIQRPPATLQDGLADIVAIPSTVGLARCDGLMTLPRSSKRSPTASRAPTIPPSVAALAVLRQHGLHLIPQILGTMPRCCPA